MAVATTQRKRIFLLSSSSSLLLLLLLLHQYARSRIINPRFSFCICLFVRWSVCFIVRLSVVLFVCLFVCLCSFFFPHSLLSLFGLFRCGGGGSTSGRWRRRRSTPGGSIVGLIGVRVGSFPSRGWDQEDGDGDDGQDWRIRCFVRKVRDEGPREDHHGGQIQRV